MGKRHRDANKLHNVNIDIKDFIKDRIWFGWYYSTWGDAAVDPGWHWCKYRWWTICIRNGRKQIDDIHRRLAELEASRNN